MSIKAPYYGQPTTFNTAYPFLIKKQYGFKPLLTFETFKEFQNYMFKQYLLKYDKRTNRFYSYFEKETPPEPTQEIPYINAINYRISTPGFLHNIYFDFSVNSLGQLVTPFNSDSYPVAVKDRSETSIIHNDNKNYIWFIVSTTTTSVLPETNIDTLLLFRPLIINPDSETEIQLDTYNYGDIFLANSILIPTTLNLGFEWTTDIPLYISSTQISYNSKKNDQTSQKSDSFFQYLPNKLEEGFEFEGTNLKNKMYTFSSISVNIKFVNKTFIKFLSEFDDYYAQYL